MLTVDPAIARRIIAKVGRTADFCNNTPSDGRVNREQNATALRSLKLSEFISPWEELVSGGNGADHFCKQSFSFLTKLKDHNILAGVPDQHPLVERKLAIQQLLQLLA